MRHFNLKAVAIGIDPIEINRFQRSATETFEAARGISERHASDYLHVFGRSQAEHETMQWPIDHANAIAVPRTDGKIGISDSVEKARNVIGIMRQIAIHFE